MTLKDILVPGHCTPVLNENERELESFKEFIDAAIFTCGERLDSASILLSESRPSDSLLILKELVGNLRHTIGLLMTSDERLAARQQTTSTSELGRDSLSRSLAALQDAMCEACKDSDQREYDKIMALYHKAEESLHLVRLVRKKTAGTLFHTRLDDFKRQRIIHFMAYAVVLLIGIAVFFAASPSKREIRVTDLTLLRNALENYYKDNRSYPHTNGEWFGLFWGQSMDNWIPGLAPTYIPKLPMEPRRTLDKGNQYIYRSDGKDFKLIVHSPDPEDFEYIKKQRANMVDPARTKDGKHWAYGYWTPNAVNW